MKFTDYAHDNYERSETVELLVEEYDWPEDIAWRYAKSHNPLYEVEVSFDYDPETNKLTVLCAWVDGILLTPKGTYDEETIQSLATKESR